MESKKDNTTIENKTNPQAYAALVLFGIVLVSSASVFAPILIFGLLIFAPMALKSDMETAKPIVSIGLVLVCAAFLFFAKSQYDLFKIVVICTGMSSLVCFIVWRFLGIEKFEIGVTYSAVLSIGVGIIVAMVFFILGDRQPFSLQIVDRIQQWLIQSDSQSVKAILHSMTSVIGSMSDSGEFNFAVAYEAMLAGSTTTKAEQMSIVMPYIKNSINRYSILVLMVYPMVAGVLTWWRGNYKIYKDQRQTDEAMLLKPKPFASFTAPRWLITTMLFLLVGAVLVQSSVTSDVLMWATFMVQSLAFMILAIQGFAVLEYFLKRNNIFKFAIVRIVFLLLVTIVSGGILPLFIGGIDIFINIRAVYAQAKELKEKSPIPKQEDKKDSNKNN